MTCYLRKLCQFNYLYLQCLFHNFVLFEFGRLVLDSGYITKGQKINHNLGSKCFAIVAAEETVVSLPDIVNTLTEQIKETPIFVQLISKEIDKNLSTQTFDINSTIFRTARNSKEFSIKCSKHPKKTEKLTWRIIEQKTLHDICPDRQSVLRIAYNKSPPFFYLKDSKLDMDTIETVYVQTFLEKHGLVAEWHDANRTWGSKDLNGTWNGVVGKVGYSICDVGISIISYTMERGSFIDYSHPVGVDALKWVSKPPEKLPPATNIIRIFDPTSWLLIFISMLATSLMLLIASRAGLSYGVGTSDITSVLLTPFQTLNAEFLPVWFSRRASRRFFSPGFTGNYILLMWTVMGSLVTMAFLCNIRAMLMKPVFQNPIDSTKDIITQGKTPIIGNAGSFWPQYMKTSINKWERLAGKTGYATKNLEERNEVVVEKVYKAGSHVFLSSPEIMTYKVQNTEFFRDKHPPIFHFSSDMIR